MIMVFIYLGLVIFAVVGFLFTNASAIDNSKFFQRKSKL